MAPLVAAAGLSLMFWAWMQAPPRVADIGSASPELQAVLWPVAHPVAPFQMRTHRGEAFDEASLKGQWNFVFFGFLQCPDVCPTTLQALRGFRRSLLENDPAALRHRFIFVTVDPGNDTAERIGPYLQYFDPEFIGLIGSGGELAKLADSLAVYYARQQDKNGNSNFDHTAAVMVVDPAGRVVGALPSPHDPAMMTRRFLALQRHVEAGDGNRWWTAARQALTGNELRR